MLQKDHASSNVGLSITFQGKLIGYIPSTKVARLESALSALANPADTMCLLSTKSYTYSHKQKQSAASSGDELNLTSFVDPVSSSESPIPNILIAHKNHTNFYYWHSPHQALIYIPSSDLCISASVTLI